MYDNEYITTTYGYNVDGIRTYRQVYDDDTGDTTRYEYTLNGSQIIKETVYLNNVEQYTLVYIYDEIGSPIGMKYRTPSMAKNIYTCFFFEKNLQGDIIAVYDASGTKLIAYTYDAWGNFTTTYPNGSSAASIASRNPFKYRGYYYDADLGLYYLQSRYYNPVWGRFINADCYTSTGQGLLGYNMFAYCNNSPVIHSDKTGEFLVSALIAFLTAKDISKIAIGDVEVNNKSTNSTNVQVKNSYQISTPWVQYAYAFYLNHINKSTKEVIKGSTSGVVFEWGLHNVAYLLGFEKGKDLDVGATIFSDNNAHPILDQKGNVSLNGLMSVGMTIMYMALTPAVVWVPDFIISERS